MRYVQLRAFHYVCIHGGFSRAAEALFLTQPAISDQIRKLEEEYDTLLFYRRGKQVLPTPAGEQLLDITHRFFDAESQAEEFLSERRTFVEGTLRIVADSAVHVTALLGRFAEQFPSVKVKLYSGNSRSVISQLKDYQADIGVLGDHEIEACFDQHVLNTSPLIAFVGASHALARRKTVRFESLLAYPLVLREKGSRTRAYIEGLAKANDLELTATIEAEGREAVQDIVAVGTGVGFVSRAELTRDPSLVPITISDSTIKMQETLVALSERARSRLIAAFFAVARNQPVTTRADASSSTNSTN